MKNIVFVDASYKKNGKSQIALFHLNKKVVNTLEVYQVSNSSEAELYAIFYAITYIKKIKNKKKSIILSDSLSNVSNKNLKKLLAKNNILLSWIPREINVVADKNSREKPNLSKKYWKKLKVFHDELLKKIKS